MDIYKLYKFQSKHPTQIISVSSKKPSSILKSNFTLSASLKNRTLTFNLAIDCLTTTIQHAIEASVFTPKHKNTQDYIRHEITTKNRLRYEWHRHRDPTIKRQLNATISFIRNLLKIIELANATLSYIH